MPEHHPRLNHLLAALPPEVYTRLLPHLEYIDLPLGKVLYESGDALRHVYFPIDCIVSLLYVMKDGASAEISVVGNEGLIGAVELEPIAGQPTARAFRAFLDAYEAGILIRTTGDTIAMSPPLIISEAEIDELIGTLRAVLQRLN